MIFKNSYIKLFFCISIYSLSFINLTEGQVCQGSWINGPGLNYGCFLGRAIGETNIPEPPGCPVNPIYTLLQTNTFTFTNPVGGFIMDFQGFDGIPLCSRLEIKINGIFFPLSALNFSDLPSGSTCTGDVSNIMLTSDGYITESLSGGEGHSSRWRITINNVNATTVTVSTNDGVGTVASSPYNCLDVVPLNLISFEGHAVNACKALISWTTGIESNIKDIEVQQSESGSEFKNIGDFFPKGSDSSYSFQTDNLYDEFYRLKINDLDGQFRFSEIINIKSNCKKKTYIITPNPVNDIIKISGINNNQIVIIFDSFGNKVLSTTLSSNNDKINVSRLSKGIYFVKVNSGEVIKVFKTKIPHLLISFSVAVGMLLNRATPGLPTSDALNKV